MSPKNDAALTHGITLTCTLTLSVKGYYISTLFYYLGAVASVLVHMDLFSAAIIATPGYCVVRHSTVFP